MLMKRWGKVGTAKKIVIVIIVVGLLPTCILAVFSSLQGTECLEKSKNTL